MQSQEFKDVCIQAINGATVKRGKNKGKLLKTCPKMGTDAAAAWQALQFELNPYRVGMAHMIFFTERQQTIFDAIQKSVASHWPAKK